ncbi:FxsA family protein [Gaopeijia maritima]|uniref:FxsA family protein n=1 Tax=Gaopeijia maritima TaxID=3119007 RepID=A0ABU9E520_9BACT
MFGRLALLFVVVPLLELALLVQMGQWVGLWPTLFLVFGTGVVGAALARSQGLRTLAAVQTEMAQGRLPGGALLDGLAVLVGGAFLLTPGLLTDVAGFTLLIPTTRRLVRGVLARRLEKMQRDGTLRVGFVAPMGFGGSPFGPQGPRTQPRDDSAARSAGLDPRNEVGTQSDRE